MYPLIKEAIKITVVFIEAVGIFLQTKATRESQDLDFAVTKELPAEMLDDKRYFVRKVG